MIYFCTVYTFSKKSYFYFNFAGRISKKAQSESTASTELKRHFWLVRHCGMIKDRVLLPPLQKWPFWNGSPSSPASNGWLLSLNVEVPTISPSSSKVLLNWLLPSAILLQVSSLIIQPTYHNSHSSIKKNQQRIFPIPQKENFWTQMEIGIESYRLIFGLWNVAREITLSFVCCSIELTEWDVYYSSNELWISTETLHDTRLPSSGTGPKGTKSASNMDPHQQNEPRRSGNSMRVDWIAGRPQPVEAGNDSHTTYPSRGSN